MPGGFSAAELSDSSPLKAIASFPQELVLLGRATVLIKGISKRLNLKWSLAEKWEPLAEKALECGIDGCTMPTWSAPTPAREVVLAAAGVPASAAAATGGGSSSNELRFRQVLSSYGGSGKLLRKWAISKAGRVVPTRVKKIAVKAIADRIE